MYERQPHLIQMYIFILEGYMCENLMLKVKIYCYNIPFQNDKIIYLTVKEVGLRKYENSHTDVEGFHHHR